jgi:lycopene beta-cyclase
LILHPPTFDILVLGNGPAGLAITAACAHAGLRTACVAPAWPPHLPNTYGVWLDDLPHDLHHTARHVWDHPHAIFSPGCPIDLNRRYALLDNAALAAHLMQRARAHGAELLSKSAQHITHAHERSSLHLADEEPLDARLIIDATGAYSRFTRRGTDSLPGAQIAWGAVIRGLDAKLVAPMILMDYAHSPDEQPSFLYAMQLDDQRVFLEETILVSRPAMSAEALRHRLASRLRNTLGVELDALHIEEIELCNIPMGLALPDLGQRTLAYGAAASMVHPASGYQLARAMSWAAQLADDLARAIQREGLRGESLSSAAWRALWTPTRLRQRELYLYGMEMLLAMRGDQLRAFFETFFALPQHRWAGFLSGELSMLELTSTMWHLFGAASMRTRRDLVRPALTGALPHLLRGLRP